MNSVCFLRNTSDTTPCMRLPPFFSSLILTTTVSPCKAVLKSAGFTITSTGRLSTITKPIPERLMSNTPFSAPSCFEYLSFFFFFEFFLPMKFFFCFQLRVSIELWLRVRTVSGLYPQTDPRIVRLAHRDGFAPVLFCLLQQ